MNFYHTKYAFGKGNAIYNLWYFIKVAHSIIGERWKDLVEDAMRNEKEIEKFLITLFLSFIILFFPIAL